MAKASLSPPPKPGRRVYPPDCRVKAAPPWPLFPKSLTSAWPASFTSVALENPGCPYWFPISVDAPLVHHQAIPGSTGTSLNPTTCSPLLIPRAHDDRVDVTRLVHVPLASRNGAFLNAGFLKQPTIWPASLMSRAELSGSLGFPNGGIPRSGITPP